MIGKNSVVVAIVTIVSLILATETCALGGVPAEFQSIDPLSQVAPESLEPQALPADERPAAAKILATLWELAVATAPGDTLRVIISLHDPIIKEGLAAEEHETRRVANVARVEHSFIQSVGEIPLKNVRGLSHLAIVIADVLPKDLTRLAALPTVKSIERVWQVVPARVEGGALINATTLRNSFNGTGAGISVAVVDSGVDSTHPELAGRVTVQADYTGSGGGTIDGTSHGTSVAGIVAGTSLGVAPQAEIWAVKVFHTDGTGPSSDLITLALNDLFAQRNNFGGLNIVNMSLGGPPFSNSDCDAVHPSLSAAVNQLVSAGIPVFAASGNDASLNGIAQPACLANVISVGAVSDAAGVPDSCSPGSTSTQPDQIQCYSNSGVPLDILAPSSCASTPRSSLQGGGLNPCFDGTSAASPYAAGVAAQILSLRPDTTPAQLRTALMTTGRPITDVNSITRNRIDAVQAYQALTGTGGGPCVDSATTLCLLNKRFKVEATYRTAGGQTGAAKAVRLTDETGYFWFFNASNIEAVFKLLNACNPSLGNRFWVFAGGLTDVEVTTVVTDTSASGVGSTKTYMNPLGTPFQPISDLTSFATCP